MYREPAPASARHATGSYVEEQVEDHARGKSQPSGEGLEEAKLPACKQEAQSHR
jgi:hypothetical protein